MAADRSEEDATVERHDGKHHQVVQPATHREENRPKDARGNVTLRTRSQPAGREELHEHGHGKDDGKRDGVHLWVGAWPPVEEDLGIVAPEEGHVHHPHLLTGMHARAVPVGAVMRRRSGHCLRHCDAVVCAEARFLFDRLKRIDGSR